MNNQFFYVGQKAFIKNDKGQLLILNDPDRGLDLPGGRVQVSEFDLDEALKREVREETGLEIEVGKPFIRWCHTGTEGTKDAGKPFLLVGFHCKYISGSIRLSHEHDEFHWVDKLSYKQYKGDSGYMKVIDDYFNMGT